MREGSPYVQILTLLYTIFNGKGNLIPTWKLVPLPHSTSFTADRLAQLVERRTSVREVSGSSPDRTNTQGLKITEENVLPL